MTGNFDDSRNAVIEECAKVLDNCAQDWHRIRDPGMAANARAYARKIRSLAAVTADPVEAQPVAWAPFHLRLGWDFGCVKRDKGDVEHFVEGNNRDWLARPLYDSALAPAKGGKP